jgi:hypothetical protein
MNTETIRELIKRVSHQRERAGVKESRPGTYVQFIYKCKPDCVRCALDKAAR